MSKALVQSLPSAELNWNPGPRTRRRWHVSGTKKCPVSLVLDDWWRWEEMRSKYAETILKVCWMEVRSFSVMCGRKLLKDFMWECDLNKFSL